MRMRDERKGWRKMYHLLTVCCIFFILSLFLGVKNRDFHSSFFSFL